VKLSQLLAALLIVPWCASARADELQEFELAKSRYDVGSYPEAADQFAKLLEPSSPRFLKDGNLRKQARPLYAASLVALGRNDEADEVFTTLLREDPFYQPAPGLFPQQVTDRFIAVRARMRQELEELARKSLEEKQRRELEREQARVAEAKRITELEKLAREEQVVTTRSRWIAMLPLGAGQFQNGDNALGWFFAVSEVLTTPASIVSGAIATNYSTVRCDQPTEDSATVVCDKLESYFITARTVNWVSFGTTATLAIAGIIEAQASFEDETTEVRTRDLPPALKVKPQATVSPQGFMLGIRGTF
jgi:tetratricopeptide (TPR) repeat protein